MLKIGICLAILITPENLKKSHVNPPEILIGDLCSSYKNITKLN